MTPLPVLSCDGCGACCTGLVSPPFYGPGDPSWQRLLAERPGLALAMLQDMELRYASGGPFDGERPCLWYDPETRRCRHYEWRPDICREFDAGEPDCLRFRREQGID